MRKRIIAFTAVAAIATSAFAGTELRLTSGANTITVVDGDANDQAPDAGVVYYNGPVGANWNINITVGTSKPADGTPAEPFIDLDTESLSQSAGDLKIEFTDTDFTATSGTFDAEAGGLSDGSVEFQYFIDGSNTPFGTSLQLADFPNQTDVYAASSNGTFSITAPYSLTVEALIHHNGRGSTGFDASLQLTPPEFQPPTIQCAGDTDLGCNPPIIPSCDTNSITATASCGVAGITCAAAGPDIVTGCLRERDLVYTVTDNCGLSATCTQHIFWTVDTTPPTFNSQPPDQDLGCNPESIPDCSLDVTASDDCSPKAIVTCSSTNAVNGCAHTRTITYVATDKCGNKATYVQHITWTVDTTAPTFTKCADDKDLGCNPTTIPDCDTNSVAATDDCTANPAITCSSSDSADGCAHTRTIIYVATDACGNSSTCVQHVTWRIDTTAPSFTSCPSDKDLGCNPSTIPDCDTNSVSATDNCTANPTITCSSSDSVSGCGHSRTITYVATDACGNSASCIQHITWTADTTAPAFTKCAYDKDLGCNPTSIPVCATSAVSATDNCGTPTVTCSSADSTNGCGRTRTITYVATDACGNSASCVQHITWNVNTVAPTFTKLPTSGDLGCNPATIPGCASGEATASGACGDARVTCTTTDSGSSCNKSRTIIYTATDACGNTATATRTFTWVSDHTPPVITCPPAKSTNCLPYCTFSRNNWCQFNGGNNGCWYLNSCFYLMYGFNGCQIGVTNNGHYLRCTTSDYCRTNCNYSGPCGTLDRDCVNPSSCSAGSFASHCLALKLNVDFCDFGAKWGICSPIGDCVVHDDSSPCNGRKVRDILDICNKAIGGCNITSYGCSIGDLTNLCDKINKCCDSWQPTAWATCHLLPQTCTNNTGVATAVDDCDPHPTITSTDVVSANCGGSIVTRIWTATDKCGNSSTCAQQLSNYSDKTPPVFTQCASDKDLGCNPTTIPSCDVTQVTAIDNCGTPTVTCSSSDSSYGCSHTRTITYTATDGNGNKATCVQHITWVVDTTAPVITCPPPATTYCKPYCTYSRTNWCATPNGNNCSSILTNCYSKIYGSSGCKIGGQSYGSYYLLCNSATSLRSACKFTGTPDKQDCNLVNPTSCKSAVFAANCYALKLNVDYCDYASQSGQCSKIGDCVLDDNTQPCNGYKVRDILNVCHTALGGGDISSYGCSISQLNDLCEKINNSCESGKPNTWATCHLLPTSCKNTGTATATDNCDSNVDISYTDVISSGSCTGSTVMTRIWKATDNCGNASTCSQVLTMSSCPPPVVSCPSSCSAKLNYYYNSSFTATGGSGGYTYAITSGKLPTGLTLNASTGAVTGKPTCTGSFCFTVQVTDSANGTDTQNCCITVSYY